MSESGDGPPAAPRSDSSKSKVRLCLFCVCSCSLPRSCRGQVGRRVLHDARVRHAVRSCSATHPLSTLLCQSLVCCRVREPPMRMAETTLRSLSWKRASLNSRTSMPVMAMEEEEMVVMAVVAAAVAVAVAVAVAKTTYSQASG